jgi:hypothetical protein
VQPSNEAVYFCAHNHGIVQRIALDPGRDLAAFTVKAVANEVIVGVLGITLGR